MALVANGVFTVELPNGMKITGTADQISDAARRLGFDNLGNDGQYYMSESKGLVRITAMEATHIRNAMLKIYRHWAGNLSHLSGMDLINALTTGPERATHATFYALLTEYIKRHR